MPRTMIVIGHLHFGGWAKLNEVPSRLSELLTKMIDLGSFPFLYRFMPPRPQSIKVNQSISKAFSGATSEISKKSANSLRRRVKSCIIALVFELGHSPINRKRNGPRVKERDDGVATCRTEEKRSCRQQVLLAATGFVGFECCREWYNVCR